MKLKLKYLITIFAIFMLLFTTFSFATDSKDDIMLINEKSEETDIRDSDLYINDKEYDIKNTINGNTFIAVDTLNIDPNENGGIIEGNLFAAANNVNIKSNVSYSDTEKDDLGNPAMSIDKYCTISGNAFISAKKFILEPGSKIYGDLYICANEIELSQGSIIYGNVFLTADKLTLNSEIGGSLYANVNSFDMQYFGFISRDLHLSAKHANLNGYVYRNSYIEAKDLTTDSNFINEKDFNLTDANTFSFSGEIKGNASLNVKNLNLKNKDNSADITCKISGNLSYSSKQSIEIPDGIIAGEINYSNYIHTPIISVVWNYILGLITSLVCVYIIYLIISKFIPKYIDRISNISAVNLLKFFGIGLGCLIIIPIIIALLFISSIGKILGVIALLSYIILILIAKPLFIISISKYAKDKLPNNINIYLYILAITVILSLINLIPFLGFIISLIVYVIGVGLFVNSLRFKN